MSIPQTTEFKIGNRGVGGSHPPFIIAEVAQTHDGSLGQAHAFIDVARESGADAIKFQTHIASEESTVHEPWRVRFSRQDDTRFGYWQRMEFTRDQWLGLKQHADECGIAFLSSPFSIAACELLAGIGVPAWKIASGEVHNPELLGWLEKSGKPLILSSGLSTSAETIAVANRLRDKSLEFAVLHCTTRYPTPPQEVGLNVFTRLRDALAPAPVGLSDHSASTVPGTVAVFLGAAIVEVHLTLHEKMFGPDVSSSLTPGKLAQLVKDTRFAWEMRQSGVDKDVQLAALGKERRIFGRSLVASRDIPAGTRISDADLAFKKPGGGLAFEERADLLGKRARQTIVKDTLLKAEDVE